DPVLRVRRPRRPGAARRCSALAAGLGPALRKPRKAPHWRPTQGPPRRGLIIAPLESSTGIGWRQVGTLGSAGGPPAPREAWLRLLASPTGWFATRACIGAAPTATLASLARRP